MFFSLRSRLLAVFAVLLIFPFALLAFILSEASTTIIKTSIESSTTQTMEQFASHVTTLLKQVEDTGNQVMGSRMTQDWLAVQGSSELSSRDKVAAKQRVREFFSSYAVNNSNGISISAFTEETGGLWTQDRSYKTAAWYEEFTTVNKRWTIAHKDVDQPDEYMRSRSVNSFIFPLVQLQSFRSAGIIKVNYPTSLLRDTIGKITIGRTGRVILLTHDGQSVLNQDIDAEQSDLSAALSEIEIRYRDSNYGVFPLKQSGESRLFFYRKLPGQDWIIAGIVPERELYEQISYIRQTILIVSVVLLILAMLAAFWLSAGITKPLSRMARAMKYVQRGEFGQAEQLMPKVRDGHSEVDYVTAVFEQMTVRLRHLIETEFETNLSKRNAEYKALLLQINPHFYNNTLEIISGLAAMKREDLVMDATEALGKMMRYSLNLNTDLVKVSEEMAYIRDYLFILHLRHEVRLQVTIKEDPQAAQLVIAKFILQPIVENAVKYSLEKEGTAQIHIETAIRNECLLLTVTDNGIGMQPDLADDLRNGHRKGDLASVLNSEGHSIGLRNVLSRCRLMYGEAFDCILHSEPGEGTEISLCLPIVRS
ncbi:cache domain-containing sensor histidine kinase [Paenibacillus hexagrammi]|uniref:histidine kinase n=1 Tax=Paenibacillus hexagrammi TaxID=2908839 RepID=A0ABY3SSH2_9BACL|nr:sensor histidine kinase [Paenibacillus sp. YPD9-1]UJF36111.1 histidine kinase [Paenibacillus sp. YPD9-1]